MILRVFSTKIYEQYFILNNKSYITEYDQLLTILKFEVDYSLTLFTNGRRT